MIEFSANALERARERLGLDEKYARKQVQSFCAGWLLDQRRRNYPSLQLRVRMLDDVFAQQVVETLTDAGLELFPSIKDMCIANMTHRPRRKRSRGRR